MVEQTVSIFIRFGTRPKISSFSLIDPLIRMHSMHWFVQPWLIGLVSMGNTAGTGNCDKESYTLFTSIERFKDFIFKTMHPDEDIERKGQFCDVHDQIECAACDEGYILEGKQCVQGYGSGPRSFLGTGTKFFDGNYCSERCPELMHCEVDETPEPVIVNANATTNANSTLPRYRVIYNPCICLNGTPRKKCSGTGEACDPLKCKENHKHNAETDSCEYFNPSEVSSKSVALYLAHDCETTTEAEEVVGDHYCGRLYHSPFSSCDVPINDFYFTCVKELCLKGKEERKDAICKELARYEHTCHSKIGDFDKRWHALSKSDNATIAFNEHSTQSAFQVTDRGEDYVSIDIKGTLLSLDVYGSMFHNNVVRGQHIVLGHYIHRTDQLWTMEEVDPLHNMSDEDLYYFRTKDKPQYALYHNIEDNRLSISDFKEGQTQLMFKMARTIEFDDDLTSWRTPDFCFKCPKKNQHREGQKCVPNVCKCDHGEPVANIDCTLHGDQQCKSCQPSHMRTRFRHFDAFTNFQEGKQICHDHNMVLAKIKTKQDSEELQEHLKKVRSDKLKEKEDIRYNDDESYAFYLGARAAEGFPGSHANGFYWLNDKDELIHDEKLHLAQGFTNWEEGQPVSKPRDCLIVEWRMKKNYRSGDIDDKIGYKWHDIECHVEEKKWDYYLGDEGLGVVCQHENYHCLDNKYGIPQYRKYHFYGNSYDNLDGANGYCQNRGQQIASFYNQEDLNVFNQNLQDLGRSSWNFWLGAKYYLKLEAEDDSDADPEEVTYKDGYYCLGPDGKMDMKYPLITALTLRQTDEEQEECLVYKEKDFTDASCEREDDNTPSPNYRVACVNRKQYFFFPYVRTSWDGAVDYCKDLGMQLPTFQSMEEFEIFEKEKYSTQRSNYWPYWWIGIRRSSYRSRRKRWHYYRYRYEKSDGEHYFYYVDQDGNPDTRFPVKNSNGYNPTSYNKWSHPYYYTYYPFRYQYDCVWMYGYKGYQRDWTKKFYSGHCNGWWKNVVCEKNTV